MKLAIEFKIIDFVDFKVDHSEYRPKDTYYKMIISDHKLYLQ